MLSRSEKTDSEVTRWIRPGLVSVAFAVVWVALAWRTPTSTHHFAPLVTAAE